MKPRRHLPMVPTALAERHPADSWVLAEPVPLSQSSQRALRGLIDALLPPLPAPRPPGIEERVLVHITRMLAYMPAPLRAGFHLLTHVLDWAPCWRFKAARRLHTLSAAEASNVLYDLGRSRWLPIRLMLLPPKAMILSTYYDQDEVHAALDYAPKAFIRERASHREERARAAEPYAAPPHAGAAE